MKGWPKLAFACSIGNCEIVRLEGTGSIALHPAIRLQNRHHTQLPSLYIHIYMSVCIVVMCHTGSCAGITVLMCQNSKKEFYKKFLYEPLPVEVGGHDSSKQN